MTFVCCVRHPYKVSKLPLPSSMMPSVDMPVAGPQAEPLQTIM